jgi:CubicO group peptidase (beta-lactamase class C family)
MVEAGTRRDAAPMHRVRRRAWAGVLAATIACVAVPMAVAGPAGASQRSARIDTVIRDAFRTGAIHAVIVQATVDGRTVFKRAYGWSKTGIPANTRMHFRNGNVAAMYMSTLLLRLVERGKAGLDDPVSKFVPGLPDGDRVTLRMLAGMTAGYQDYVRQPEFPPMLYSDPFAPFTTREQLDLGLSKPIQFEPGTNFAYAHTNYVILGLALEKIAGLPLQSALSRHVLRPLGLRNTQASQTARIPEPVLHTFSSERRGYLGIPAGTRFSEESTFWNPSWSFARGSVETTDIADLTRTAIGIGRGELLKPDMYRLQIAPRIGFGRPQESCLTCRTLTREAGYGLGVFRNGSWIAAQPLFAGLGSVAAYLPGKRVSIAVTVALSEGAYDADGIPTNHSIALYRTIGRILAPADPPPAT